MSIYRLDGHGRDRHRNFDRGSFGHQITNREPLNTSFRTSFAAISRILGTIVCCGTPRHVLAGTCRADSIDSLARRCLHLSNAFAVGQFFGWPGEAACFWFWMA